MKRKIMNLTATMAAAFAAAAMVSCSESASAPKLPQVSMPAEGSATPVAVTCDEVLNGGYSHSFKVTLDQPSTAVLMGDVYVDESLVEAYNTANGTDYEVLPQNIYKLAYDGVMIPAGATESNDITVDFPGTLFGVNTGSKYLLPVAVKLDSAIESEFVQGIPVHYLAIDVDREIIYTPGLDFRTYSTDMNRYLYLPDNEVVPIEGNTHTFEMRVYCYGWHSGTNYIGSWHGKDTGNKDESFDGCELRATNATGASNIGNRQADLTTAGQNKIIPTGKWVTISVACDGTKTAQNREAAYFLYFDGELISSAVPTKRYGTSSSQRFAVGYTLDGFKFGFNGYPSYYFNGLVGEIRMWKDCLTQEQIKANLRTVENPSADKMYAYWKLDEGEGNLLKDYSGNGRDLQFPENAKVVWGAEME